MCDTLSIAVHPFAKGSYAHKSTTSEPKFELRWKSFELFQRWLVDEEHKKSVTFTRMPCKPGKNHSAKDMYIPTRSLLFPYASARSDEARAFIVMAYPGIDEVHGFYLRKRACHEDSGFRGPPPKLWRPEIYYTSTYGPGWGARVHTFLDVQQHYRFLAVMRVSQNISRMCK